MNVSSLPNVGKFNSIEAFTDSVFKKSDKPEVERAKGFDALLDSAMKMIKETNGYSNAAADAELDYAMGGNTSTTDVMVAQMKANVSLQYTVALRNAVMDAYKEIMQLQF
ncbi:MAG: flagellar hook-basal body complex protein FliE [Lachnospiraceae bacterium]|nr:flagellar hook-basal body complex protein FliE [Lachnospiraceae bacterium]